MENIHASVKQCGLGTIEGEIVSVLENICKRREEN
jgi:hypothetical protein